jgi:DNA-binding NarL/FixJ family response regulator
LHRTPENPLPPALLQLLQASADVGTVDAKRLADVLTRSPSTIRTQFQRICKLMQVHSRAEAVLMALHRGWISVDSDTAESIKDVPELDW